MGVFEALLLFPDLIFQLITQILTDLLYRRAMVDLLSIFKNFHLKIFEGAVFKTSLLPVFLRIHIANRPGGVNHLIEESKIICYGLSFLIVNPVYFFQSGIGNLFSRFGDLYFRNQFSVFLYRCHFIDSTENRIGCRCNQPLPNAEAVNFRALMDDGANRIFIKPVGGNNKAVFQPGLIQHFSGFLGEVSKVSGIQADSSEAFSHGLQNLLRHTDCIGDTAFQHIVGIHQEDRAVRIGFRIFFESFILRVAEHDPAVGHGTGNRNLEHLSRKDGGRACDAPDIGCTGTVHRSIHIVCPSCAEIRHTSSLCRTDNSVGLCGDQRLMIHLKQKRRFNQLCIQQRRHHCNEGFIGIDHGAFRHGVDISMKAVRP